jgi:hypothetical protein
VLRKAEERSQGAGMQEAQKSPDEPAQAAATRARKNVLRLKGERGRRSLSVQLGGCCQCLTVGDLFRAYIWDCLAFEDSLSVLKHARDAIKGWHRHLGLRVPLDGPGDYRRITTSLSRFQPTHRILKFPIHKDAVRRLLLLPLPPHPQCAGVLSRARPGWRRCPICWAFLHR